jgi:CTP synthase (UTP-ammonia lyase)
MDNQVRIGIIGDYNPQFPPHLATEWAIDHAANSLHLIPVIEWIETPRLAQPVYDVLHSFDALWCAPGSPYQYMQGALEGIRFARESNLPFLGTCAGFQHVVIEYARNVLGFADAQHAEYDPAASRLFVNLLACSLVGKTMTILLNPTSHAYRLYGQGEVSEQYYCQFGLNPAYQTTIEEEGLRIAGYDTDGEARILELEEHPFFIATLFLPQLNSSAAQPHPLITAYLQSAVEMRKARQLMVQNALADREIPTVWRVSKT